MIRLVLVVLTAVFAIPAAILLVTGSSSPGAWGAPGAPLAWGAAFAIIGYVVDRSRPDNPIGRLLQVAGIGSAALEVFYRVGVMLSGRSTTSLGIIGSLAPSWMWMIPIAALFHALAIFPDGHLLSPRWRVAVLGLWTGAVLSFLGFFFGPSDVPGFSNPLEIATLDALTTALQFASYLFLQVSALLVVISIIIRFRQATGDSRLQLKWVVYASALNGLVIVIIEVIFRLFVPRLYQPGTWVVSLFILLIPIAIGVAILRYRLYAIDRLVSRTVSYGLVIGLSAMVYLGAVFLLRAVLPGESDLAVAGSTLAVAAMFNPARRRLQETVDRRFNRARYDAEQVVASFAARLRNQVELASLTGGLTGVVTRTVQPASASVWIRQD
ncbi:MAG TPA: hypothetical protein VJQ57_01415 [Acidimicrobiia bacterium]|nr:hypothetical protein [Acidimicrobiia bacterium]